MCTCSKCRIYSRPLSHIIISVLNARTGCRSCHLNIDSVRISVISSGKVFSSICDSSRSNYYISRTCCSNVSGGSYLIVNRNCFVRNISYCRIRSCPLGLRISSILDGIIGCRSRYLNTDSVRISIICNRNILSITLNRTNRIDYNCCGTCNGRITGGLNLIVNIICAYISILKRRLIICAR